MSNLIVMPGSREFAETLAKTQKKPRATKTPLQPADLVGRTLMLNTALVRTFQCGGFVLGPNRPVAVVDYQARQAPIHMAIAEGKLIDVTGKDMTKGYKNKNGETTAITSEDTGKRVFVAADRHGNLYVATPKSKAEAARFEREIRKTGGIKGVDFTKDMTGFAGGITEEIVETSLPVKGKKKAKKNVRTRRSLGKSI